MTKIASDWKDYEIIATGDGKKLERWNKFLLLRPDPQVVWKAKIDLDNYPNLSASYSRSSTGGGKWNFNTVIPEDFTISYKNYKFSLKLMGFKHTGLFPEQSVNWDMMDKLIKSASRPINVLNLFGYTGGASVACLSAGASVCHVDAANAMVERCKTNVSLSNLTDRPIRYIVDDCFKFVAREIKRGKKYDAIIMDPPSYGRGPNGEIWKIENDIFDFVKLCSQLLSDNPLFFLINSYTTGLQPLVLSNIINSSINNKIIESGKVISYEVGLKTNEKGIILPCGASGLFYKGNLD